MNEPFYIYKNLCLQASNFKIKNAVIAICTFALLSGCGASKLAHVGETLELSPIGNPADEHPGKITMPMPSPQNFSPRDNSLWQQGSRGFFKDLRASQVGDIITVMVDVQDSAQLNNETQQRRASENDVDIGALAGFGSVLGKILPGKPDLNNLLDTQSDAQHRGSGSIARDERIQMQVAAVVTQMLPNGNMVIYGRQEMRVNTEVRELHVAGIIRPQDISTGNSITYEKIAEARVAYGGKGQLSNVQQPRYGTQIADILLPF